MKPLQRIQGLYPVARRLGRGELRHLRELGREGTQVDQDPCQLDQFADHREPVGGAVLGIGGNPAGRRLQVGAQPFCQPAQAGEIAFGEQRQELRSKDRNFMRAARSAKGALCSEASRRPLSAIASASSFKS